MIDYSESVVKKAFHVPEYCRVILALLIFVFCFSLTVLADEPINAPSSKPLPALTGNAQTDFLAVAYSQLGYEATEDNY